MPMPSLVRRVGPFATLVVVVSTTMLMLQIVGAFSKKRKFLYSSFSSKNEAI